MRKRSFFAALPLAAFLTGCSAGNPTAAPDRALFDAGSFGPGHDAIVDGAGTASRGGSSGPGR